MSAELALALAAVSGLPGAAPAPPAPATAAALLAAVAALDASPRAAALVAWAAEAAPGFSAAGGGGARGRSSRDKRNRKAVEQEGVKPMENMNIGKLETVVKQTHRATSSNCREYYRSPVDICTPLPFLGVPPVCGSSTRERARGSFFQI